MKELAQLLQSMGFTIATGRPYTVKPDPEKEWSEGEKSICKTLYQEEPLLNWPLESVKVANGRIEYLYVIPDDKAYGQIKACWGFGQGKCPAEGTNMFDLHSEKTFPIEKCRILRYEDRNIVVSPYYAEYGGMLVDLTTRKPKEGEVTVFQMEIEKPQ